jgi:Holliday junction resolvasome RuvABC ATP-dependent DNA helicase subunit
VGQEPVVASLQSAVETARERGETLGHVLLSGPAGLVTYYYTSLSS